MASAPGRIARCCLCTHQTWRCRRGGFVAQQHRQVLALPKVVVNASGRGFGDANCFPSRGQFMLITNDYHSTVSHHSADGHSTVIIPRPHGGTVIGGTKEPNNWSPNNSPSAIDEILQRIAVVCPDLPQAFTDAPPSAPTIQVQQAYIGRRPMRKGGLRLDKEVLAILKTSDNGLKNEEAAISIVHRYGAGPNGYKIGWAAACCRSCWPMLHCIGQLHIMSELVLQYTYLHENNTPFEPTQSHPGIITSLIE